MQEISSSVRQSLRIAANAIVQGEIKMRAVTIAALLAATPALAQEPPITVGFGVTTGVFEEAGDIDTYRINLTEGRDYVLGANAGNTAEVTLKGPTGTLLCTLNPWEGEGDGCEFRAGRTGYFTIQAREDNNEAGGGYSFRLHPDCRDDTRTRCKIRPGATQNHLIAWGGDVDLVRLTDLRRGRTYTATLVLADPDACSGFNLSIVTGTGATVGKDGTFKAGTDTLYAKVQGNDDFFCDDISYKLSLR
jgi:hypothetical protein